MYKNDEKKAALTSLVGAIGKFSPTGGVKTPEKNQAKKADSHLASVEMPKADKPTAAGEETSQLDQKPEEKVLSSEDKSQHSPVVATNPEMKKLSVVLSQAVRKAMSTQGQYTPYNVGVSTKPTPPAPVNPPPVGAAPQQAQPQQQPQNPAAYQGALGGPGAISPSSNPINNYGPISRSGDINGNAAFGIKNSPDSSKSASDLAKKLIQGASVAVPAAVVGATYGYYRNKKKKKPDVAPEEHKEEKKEASSDKPCSCGCGDTVKTCKCGADCSCRKPGGSCYTGEKKAGSPAWQRSEGQNSEGGLNAKGRASYNKATGGNLKAPVTESNPSGERAKRQNSFCSRMCGMKSKETGAKTKADPDSRINKSLRKWNCKCGSAYEFGQLLSGKSAASICSILDNKDTRSEGKQVEDVKPTFQETENKADLNPNDATNKKQDEKQATVDSYAGLSSGGQRWQLGESGINPRIGYKYLGGVVPMPDVSLRFGLPGVGGGIGLDPLPYVFGDSGQPSGRHANLPRSFWKKLQDGFRSPEDAFFLELSRIKDNAPIPEYENFLRSRGVGSSSEEIGMLAKILSESTDVKRNAMVKRLPMAVQSVLKNYNPKDPKSLFMGKQSSVALDIYAKYAARGDQSMKQEQKFLDKNWPGRKPQGSSEKFTQGALRRLTKDSTPGEQNSVQSYAQKVKRLKERNNEEQG